MSGAVLLAAILTALGAVGGLFFLRPDVVLRIWAASSKWIYRPGAVDYRRFLQMWDNSRFGWFQRRSTGTSSSLDLMDRTHEDPDAFRFAIWYVRLLGLMILMIAGVMVAGITIRLLS